MTRSIYSGVHRQQLFHWIAAGEDRERRPRLRAKLDDDTRRAYVAVLKGSLKDGLWHKVPNTPERIGTGARQRALSTAMTCFTEWSLGESRFHTQRYGRLGLGFSRRWVIERGGQPVTYFDPAQGPFHKLLVELHASERPELRAAIEAMTAFAKPLRPLRTPAPAPRKPRRASKAPRARRRAEPNPFDRAFGGVLPFLEEREWRIVEPVVTRLKASIPVRAGAGEHPRYFLPYVPGKDLATLVLPDNATVTLALADPYIRKALFHPERPHVVVLSLEDVGTF